MENAEGVKVTTVYQQSGTDPAVAAMQRLGSILADPPRVGYDAGYRIVHVEMNMHPANYEGGPGRFVDGDDLRDLNQLGDPDKPFACTEVFAATWEDIPELIAGLINPPLVQGMTQAILVVRDNTPENT